MRFLRNSSGNLLQDGPLLLDAGEYEKNWLHRHQWAMYILSLLISDVILIGLSFRVAYWLRFLLDLPFFRNTVVPSFPFYQGISLLLIGLIILVFAFNGLYRTQNLLGGTREYALVFRATGSGMLVVIIAGFLQPAFVLARGWLFLAWLLSFLFVSLARFILRRVVYFLRLRGYFLSRALIVGANDEGRSLAQQLLQANTSGIHVVGFIDDTLPLGGASRSGHKILGTLATLDECINRYHIGEVIISTSALTRKQIIDVFQQFGIRGDINLRLSSGLFEIITTGLQLSEVPNVPLVTVNKVRLTGIDQVLKLILDYTVGAISLFASALLFLILAVAVKLDSPGPVIHRRRVMGVNGVEFDAFKLRTMYVNGDEILAAHPDLQEELAKNHKLKNDPRVTRLGHTLRRTSLDELPQLINVMKGQMSLVGPRMISPSEVDMYERWGINLLTVKPGITGLWQVSGRSDISYDERVRLDMQYIRNWTIWLDLQILFQTLGVLFRREGAY